MDEEGIQWRITLEDTLNGKVVGFPNLASLFEHLRSMNHLDLESTEVK